MSLDKCLGLVLIWMHQHHNSWWIQLLLVFKHFRFQPYNCSWVLQWICFVVELHFWYVELSFRLVNKSYVHSRWGFFCIYAGVKSSQEISNTGIKTIKKINKEQLACFCAGGIVGVITINTNRDEEQNQGPLNLSISVITRNDVHHELTQLNLGQSDLKVFKIFEGKFIAAAKGHSVHIWRLSLTPSYKVCVF